MIPGKNTARGGFTFLETLVSILILAIVIAAISPLFIGSVRSLGSMSREEIGLAKVAAVYDSFRKACRDTLVPFWIPSGSVMTEGKGLTTVAFLHGEGEGLWTMETGGPEVHVEVDGQRTSCPAGNARASGIVVGEKLIGIDLGFEALGRKWHWREYFGSSGF